MMLRTRWAAFAVLALFIVRSVEGRNNDSSDSTDGSEGNPTPAPVGAAVGPMPGPMVTPSPEPPVVPTPGPLVVPTPGPLVVPTPEPAVVPTPTPAMVPTLETTPPQEPPVVPTPGPTSAHNQPLAQEPSALMTDDPSDDDDGGGTSDDGGAGTDDTTTSEGDDDGVVPSGSDAFDSESTTPATVAPSTQAPSTPTSATPAPFAMTDMPNSTLVGDDGDSTTNDDDSGTGRGTNSGYDDSLGDDNAGLTETTTSEGDEDGLLVAGSDTSDSESSTTGVVVLSGILAALVLGNAVWLACCLRRRKRRPTPPAGGHAATEDVEVGRLRRDLETEHTRRVKAETLIHRSSGGGLRPGAFPSVRDVYEHVGHLADDALAWTEKAFAVGGSRQAWYGTTRSVLYNTFLVCREEVQRCLDERLQHLSAFLGNDEPILLSAGDEKSLDTQYVLYECLCRTYRTIVSTEPDRMDELAGLILQRCGEPADRDLANEITSGATWPSFEALMKNYLLVFVEMALQKPGIDFEDNLGDNVAFDPAEHCDLAPYSKAPTAQHCSIVFPSIRPQEAHPHSSAKIGVVRVPA